MMTNNTQQSTEYGGGRGKTKTVAAAVNAIENGRRRGAKEEVRRWRMLMTMMMIVVGHDEG